MKVPRKKPLVILFSKIRLKKQKNLHHDIISIYGDYTKNVLT